MNAIPVRSGTGIGASIYGEKVILTEERYFCKRFFLWLLSTIVTCNFIIFSFNSVQCDVFGASGYFYLLAVDMFVLRALQWLREAHPTHSLVAWHQPSLVVGHLVYFCP